MLPACENEVKLTLFLAKMPSVGEMGMVHRLGGALGSSFSRSIGSSVIRDGN